MPSEPKPGAAPPSGGADQKFFRVERDVPPPGGGGDAPFVIRPSIETVALTRLTPNKPGVFKVRVIGAVEGRTILVETPASDGKVEFVREGEMFEVKLFSGRELVVFEASVIKSYFTPLEYLHLSYPSRVSVVSVRSSQRVELGKAVSLTYLHNGAEVKRAGIMADLSGTGTRVDCGEPLAEPGTAMTIAVALELEGEEQAVYLNLPAVLRVVRPVTQGANTRYGHGMAFVDLPLHDRLVLRTFVAERQSHPPA